MMHPETNSLMSTQPTRRGDPERGKSGDYVPGFAVDCAQSEEANAMIEPVYNPGTPWTDIPDKTILPQPGHTKRPQGTMPHERGLSPVPPSEFFCAALADPKARFCRSLASHSQCQRTPSLPPE
jgi:hypothetical protein